MPGLLSWGDRRHPRGVPQRTPRNARRPRRSPRTAYLVHRPAGLLLAVTLGGACIGLGSQVWAIAARFSASPSADPVPVSQASVFGQVSSNRLADHRSADEVQNFIASRMAALPAGDHISPVVATTGARPDVSLDRVEIDSALPQYFHLILEHYSYARLNAGALSFPDGAIATAWAGSLWETAAMPVMAPEGPAIRDPGASSQRQYGMGRSAMLPSRRTLPPSMNKQRPEALMARTSPAHFRAGSTEKSATGLNDAMPAVIRAGLAGPGAAIAAGPEAFPDLHAESGPEIKDTDPLLTDAGTAPASDPRRSRTILYVSSEGSPGGSALDAGTCHTLDRIAESARHSLRPVIIQAYYGEKDSVRTARRRAQSVRAYLARRGVAQDRVRIPLVTPYETARTAIGAVTRTGRVDIIYTSS